MNKLESGMEWWIVLEQLFSSKPDRPLSGWSLHF